MFNMECLRERYADLNADILMRSGYIVGLKVKLIRMEATLGQGTAEPRILLNNKLQLPVLRSQIREAREEMEKVERRWRS